MASLEVAFLEDSKRTLELNGDAFGVPFNGTLVHEVVRAELNARRRGTAATRTRGRVRGGGVKPWRQKGTGRARAGSIRSPLWAGGGTTFGPSPRSYTFKVNRKARRAALRCALSLHAERDSLALIDAESFEAPSTKRAAGALSAWDRQGSVLVLVVSAEEAASKSFRNLEHASVKVANAVGVADIVGAGSLVLSPAALDHVTELATASPRRTPAASEEAAT